MLQAHLCFHSVFSFFLQSPILDFTRSKPAVGPEFPAPLNPMLPEALFLRPLLSRNQPVPAVDMYFASPCCSLTPPPVSLCGPHNLVVPHLRLHPCFRMCKGALGFVLRMPEWIVRFNSVQNSLGSSIWNDVKIPCCQIAGTCSTTCTCSLVCSDLSKPVFGVFLEMPDGPFSGWVHAL